MVTNFGGVQIFMDFMGLLSTKLLNFSCMTK